jgi:hypothetical protein
MSTVQFCWRCQILVPMLDELEWAEIEPLLSVSLSEVKRYRAEHGCSLREALQRGPGSRALKRYEEITGFPETNVNAIWHHRRAIYGPPCPVCSKLLRTPSAAFCASCGTPRALGA